MSARANIYEYLITHADVIAAGLADKIYHIKAPQDPGVPYVVYGVTAGDRNHSAGGPTGLVNSTWNFAAWGADEVSTDAQFSAIRTAFDGVTGDVSGTDVRGAYLKNEQDRLAVITDGTDRPRVGKSWDFLVWYRE